MVGVDWIKPERVAYNKGALVAVLPDDQDGLQQTFAQAIAIGVLCELDYRIRIRKGGFAFAFALWRRRQREWRHNA